MPNKTSKPNQKQIALERITILLEKAKSSPHEMANRYVKLARKIAMKTRTPVPKKFKRSYCKHCYNYFKSGNYRVRTQKGKVVYYCFKCKKFSRYPYKKEKRINRS